MRQALADTDDLRFYSLFRITFLIQDANAEFLPMAGNIRDDGTVSFQFSFRHKKGPSHPFAVHAVQYIVYDVALAEATKGKCYSRVCRWQDIQFFRCSFPLYGASCHAGTETQHCQQ